MKNKFYITFLFMLVFSVEGFCTDSADQLLTTNLGEVLEISKVIVDGVEFDVDSTLSNVRRKSSARINNNETIISLSPIKLKIHTNISTPISITAEFQELNHDENLHNFAQKDLSFSPKSITINNPYDNVITDEFVPILEVRPEAKKGLYTGKVLFTLGAI